MELLQELRKWGCDIDGAMERFLDDEEFYATCLMQMAEDPSFALLGENLNNGQVAEAFECAHSLKGALANMGLTPLFDLVVQIVEPLRIGSTEGVAEYYDKLMEADGHLKELLAGAL